MNAVEATGLFKRYGKGETEVVALRDVSLAVEPGEVVALLGPSGSGKSTLLTTLGLLLEPDQGSIRLAGAPVVTDGRTVADTAAIRRERIGFVFQKANLVPFLDALDNVLLTFHINRRDGGDARKRAHELFDYLGLEGRADHMPDQLSGGQQQRVAIARALAMNPPLVLADEPTAALDSHRSRDVMLLFRRIAHERGTAVVVVTHDHRTLDAFDTVYEMEDGSLQKHESHVGPGSLDALISPVAPPSPAG